MLQKTLNLVGSKLGSNLDADGNDIENVNDITNPGGGPFGYGWRFDGSITEDMQTGTTYSVSGIGGNDTVLVRFRNMNPAGVNTFHVRMADITASEYTYFQRNDSANTNAVTGDNDWEVFDAGANVGWGGDLYIIRGQASRPVVQFIGASRPGYGSYHLVEGGCESSGTGFDEVEFTVEGNANSSNEIEVFSANSQI
jgi:hypothetical protein